MPNKPVAYTVSDANWNKIADFSVGSDQPRMVLITNTGTAGQVLVAGLHIEPEVTPDPSDVGIDLGADGSVEPGSIQPGGGQVHAVWAKGNGMAGKVSPTL